MVSIRNNQKLRDECSVKAKNEKIENRTDKRIHKSRKLEKAI